MIFDSIENAKLYYGLGERFQKAFEYLSSVDFTELKPGRYEIDGDNIYALVQKYMTKDPDDGNWEAHQNYIDLQYVFSGSETFGVVNSDYLDEVSDYDDEKDVVLLEGEGDFLQLNDGEFVVVFPHEAHMPGMAVEENEEVLKVVVKIKV